MVDNLAIFEVNSLLGTLRNFAEQSDETERKWRSGFMR